MERRNGVLWVAGFLLAFLFTEFCLFARWGLNVLLCTAGALALAAWYAGRVRRESIGLIIACLAAALPFMLYDNDFFHFLDGVLLLALLPITVATMLGGRAYRRGSPAVVADWAHAALVLPVVGIPQGFQAFSGLFRGKGRRWLGILLGMLIAIPLLAVVVPLLLRADSSFANMLGGLGELFCSVPRYIFDLVFAFCASVYLAAQYLRLRRGDREMPPLQPRQRKGWDPWICLTVIAIACGVYLLYAISQLGNVMALLQGGAPANFSVAEYARQGFFELTAVCAINFGLLALVHAFVRRLENGSFTLATRVLLGTLCGLTLLLIASAFSKMSLYIGTYGLTPLRVYTSAFMILLAFCFLVWLVKLCWNRVPLFKLLSCAALVVFLALQALNPDALIPSWNLAIARNGQQELDTGTLYALSADSVPVVYPALKGRDDEELEWWIRDMKNRVGDGDPWYSYNLARSRARRILSAVQLPEERE